MTDRPRARARRVALLLVVALLCSLVPVPVSAAVTGVNPPDTEVRAKLRDAALRYNVPSVILMAIAYQESGWRQFDASGNPVVGYNDSSQDVGIMQINTAGRSDVDRLMSDIDYNIDVGARMLDSKWKLAPGIGDRDRNVLENWYFAIWAYNGLSSTNNPNTPGGRHYQDRILTVMARTVLGSDGQPLWTPVAVTPPDPAIITDPPTWIPTPQPVHYGDLGAGFNQGYNFRVLEAPAGAVLSTTGQVPLRFLVQNVGTTTWDATCQAVLTVGDPTVATLAGQPLAQPVGPGASVEVAFLLPPGLAAGSLSLSLAMQHGATAFGAAWFTQVTLADISAAVTMPSQVTLGSLVTVPFTVTGAGQLMVTPAFELRDASGSLADSSLQAFRRAGGTGAGATSGSQGGELRFFAGSTGTGLLSPGTYQLTVTLTAAAADVGGLSGTTPFFTMTAPLQVLAPTQPGLLVVDSTPAGGSVAVDGIVQPTLTPCAVQTVPGSHTVDVTIAGYAPFQGTADTTQSPAALVRASLTPVTVQPLVLAATPANLDFGVLKAGAGVTGQLVLRMSGTPGRQGIVSTSANWIRVSPLTFDGSGVFTVGIDARWIDPGANNTGTITFAVGTSTVSVPVKAGFAPTSSVGFVLAPQAMKVQQGDAFSLALTARNVQLLFDHVDLTVAWDTQLMSLESIVSSTSLTGTITPSVDTGILRIVSDVKGLATGETVLASVQFKALAPVDKTGINLRGAVTLAGSPVRVTMGGCAVTVGTRFVAPGEPGAFGAVGEQGRVRLSWTAAAAGTYPLARYDVYRTKGTADLQAAELVGQPGPDTTSFVDRGPLERDSYYYWIMAEDTKGNVSGAVGAAKAVPIIVTDPTTKVTLVFTVGKAAVVMNGVTVPMETAPVIENGRTILPVRYIATPLGAQVLWNPKEQKVTLVGTKKVELWIGKGTALVDGVSVPIDPGNPKVVPRIVGGRTMLPLRFISETFGADIFYDAVKQTVTVTMTRQT